MNSTALSTRTVKAAVGAMLAAVALMVMSLAFANNAKAASVVGDTVSPQFNHVGLLINTTIAGKIDQLVLKPGDGDPIGINGTYTDTAGNFSIPKSGGLDFPPLVVPIGPATVNGNLELTKDGTGNYNADTGAMKADLSLALTLGVDDVAALNEELGGVLGDASGPLSCKLSPLEVSFDTAKKWPHPGKAFEDKENLEEGALAGDWRAKPPMESIAGDPKLCGLIGGFLKPVGGLWLANSATTLDPMPGATGPEPPAKTCKEIGKVGNYPKCTDPEPEVCEAPQVGEFPDCVDPKAVLGLTVTKKATVKAGKTVKIKITVKNTGNVSGTGKVTLKSSNKQVKVQASVPVTVAAGKSVVKTVVVKATKKAKGKATITAKLGTSTAKSAVTVKKAKKKKRR